MTLRSTPLALAALTALAAVASASQSPFTLTTRVSSLAGAGDAHGESHFPSVSEDGHFVAFWSEASDLVSGDTNGVADVFVRDVVNDTVERVSVGAGGLEADGPSVTPSISADGRYVAFRSSATNLFFFFDTNAVDDVFVYDRQLGVTERISEDGFGFQVSGASKEPSISADGRYVAFTSDAANLVVGDTNGVSDVFRKDRTTKVVELVSANLSGSSADGLSSLGVISSDGQFVGFESLATDLVPGDANGFRDIFLRDMQAASTEIVSSMAPGVGATANSFSPSVSAGGAFVAFQSLAPNLVSGDTNGLFDIFRWQRSTGEVRLMSQSVGGALGDGVSFRPSICDDGSSVAFQSDATNLVPGDTNGAFDIFIVNSNTNLIEGATTFGSGALGDGPSYQAAISPNGRFVAFSSEATNLVPGDGNSMADVFQYDLLTGGAEILLTNVVANQIATLAISDATPGGVVVVGWSLLGVGPTPTPWGPFALSPPILSFALVADGAGSVDLDFALPAALLGFTLSVQGLDLDSDYPTSPAWSEISL